MLGLFKLPSNKIVPIYFLQKHFPVPVTQCQIDPLVGNHLLPQRPKKKIPPTGHPWSLPCLAALELVRDGLWPFPLPCYWEPGSLEEIVLCPQMAASGGLS